MAKNVFVLGLDEFNRQLLEEAYNSDEITIHALLTYQEVRGGGDFPVENLLKIARERLQAFEDSIDAIVGYFDFPVTDMVPILAEEYGLPSNSLASVLKCEHKFWGRYEQQKVVPQCVPHFQAFNPFDADALEKIEIAYPFWIKPVKSFGSYLGFRINSREDWEHAIPIIREHIGKISTPFDFLLNQIEMPKEVAEIGGVSCIAESIISGHQVTLEGFAHNGRVQTYGIVDSLREANGSTFSRYQYPSTLPQAIQEEMRDIAVALMAFINFDNSAFNVEFFYDESRNKIWLLEVNPRISQSHGFLFYNVDGAPNHRIIIDLALGRHPNFPHRQGKYAYAAKFMHRLHQDAILEHAPDQVALEKIYQQYPNVEIDLHVQTGTRLSELRNQDSYSFDLADIYIGGDSVEALERDYQAVVNQMDFQFSLPQPEQLSAVEER